MPWCSAPDPSNGDGVWTPITTASSRRLISRMQQATVNMLADMHVQPSTLMGGLVAASASTDYAGADLDDHQPGLGLGNRQRNEDHRHRDGNRRRWRPGCRRRGVHRRWRDLASGDGNDHVVVQRRRARRRHGEHQVARVGRQRQCRDAVRGNQPARSSARARCSAMGPRRQVDSGDASPVELGVRFTSAISGAVLGIRFYKAAANTGTHTGTLWSASGSQLATGTFTRRIGVWLADAAIRHAGQYHGEHDLRRELFRAERPLFRRSTFLLLPHL